VRRACTPGECSRLRRPAAVSDPGGGDRPERSRRRRSACRHSWTTARAQLQVAGVASSFGTVQAPPRLPSPAPPGVASSAAARLSRAESRRMSGVLLP
jgi:hypothetical protein